MLCTNMMQFNCYNYLLPFQHFLCNLDHSIQVCGLMPPKMTLVKKPTSQILVTCLLGWITMRFLYIVMVFGIRLSIFVMLNFIWNKEVCTMWPCHLHFKNILRLMETQAQISSFKTPHIRVDLLPRGQYPLSYYTL